MSDIVERLRRAESTYNYDDEELFRLAADEIERLRRTLTRIWDLSEEYQYEGCGTLEKIGRIAKAALGTADQPSVTSPE